jgi:transposase
MNRVLFEDGKGNLTDEDGVEVSVVDMEVDEIEYPLEDITNYDSYLDLKPPEKPVKVKQEVEQQPYETKVEDEANNKKTRTYRSHKAEVKNYFFYLVHEKNKSIRSAAAELKVPQSTAQSWMKKANQAGDDDFEERKSGSGRPVGRPPILGLEHKEFLTNLIDEKPSLVLDEMMENLMNQFSNLQIKKTALYNFVTEKCSISLKRAHFHAIERNSPEKIEDRYIWVKFWQETDMDFMSNCVFIDEAAFHINMKRSVAWSKKGERAVVVVPKTRAKTTTILGAISPFGVVNVKVRRPKVQSSSKKRKTAGNSSIIANETTKGGTVTGHYFNFIAKTLDVMDRHPEFKENYLVMDNAPIHKHTDIRKYIEGRGYRCVYLPPYSPELNPIEQFWSVAKSKVKREQLLEEETMTSRIREACNKVLISDLRGFCQYSLSKFEDCLNRNPI